MSGDNNKRLKIFITGANGFIGKNISEAFEHKYQLLTPSHRQLELLDEKKVHGFLKRYKPDIIIHLADRGGRQKTNVDNVLSNNLRVFFNLVNNKGYFKKMIFVGSGSEFGKQHPIIRVKETDFGNRIPEDDFGFYKFIAAKYIEESANIINLRVFGIYGKYEDWRYRFISNSICKALYNKPIIINKNVYFDYLYIDDFVSILEYFIRNKRKYKTYNVGSGRRIDLKSIAKITNQVLGKDLLIRVREKGLNNEYTCNNERLLKEIGDFKFTDLRDAITELCLWYKENLKKIDKNLLDPKRVELWKK